jgi:hypothetical protein
LLKFKDSKNWSRKSRTKLTELENKCSSKHLRSESLNSPYLKRPWNKSGKRVLLDLRHPNYIL